MKFKRTVLSLSAIFISLASNAESIKYFKGTDIFLFDFNPSSKEDLLNGKNITQREGYDNQPSFTPDSKSVLYTSMLDKQADIYRYDIENEKISQVTNTPETSEYSPYVMPNSKDISVVMVEKDGVQRLWKYSEDGRSEPVIQDILPVGYYTWADKNTTAMFVLGQHNTLHVFNKEISKHNIVQEDIGRSIHKIPNKNSISFVHKLNDKKFVIKSLTLDDLKEEKITDTLSGSEDYVWTSDGKIIMGNKSDLFIYNPNTKGSWQKIANLKNYGIQEILRLAISPDGKKLALVSNIL